MMKKRSKWRYEVTERNCSIFDTIFPKYIQMTLDSVTSAGSDSPSVWEDVCSEIPTPFIKTDTYDGWFINAKGGTYGNRSYDQDIGINWFYPAKRIGRMFPRHKSCVIYKD